MSGMRNDVSCEKIIDLIQKNKWRFAKSMPWMPHEYTLRETWSDDADFIFMVEYIRAHGYEKAYKNKKYLYFDMDGKCYWTMGSPIEKTILINRANLK